MATTIVRATWTDGVGGTIINNATKNTDIYDPIDDMFGSNVTFGGTISAEGTGDHSFSGGTTGANTIVIRNTTNGTAALASLEIGNNTDADAGRIECYSASFTETGAAKQDGVALRSIQDGGLSLAAEHASGDVRLYARGTSSIATFDAATLTFSGGTPGTYAASGVLADSVNTTQTGTDADTSEKTLHSFSLPAGTLASNGQMVRFHAGGTVGNNGNTKTLRAKFGGTTIYSQGGSNWNTEQWHITATIVRTGAATQKAIIMGSDNINLAPIIGIYATPAETLSGAVTMAITGQNGTASSNDLVCEFSYVEFLG